MSELCQLTVIEDVLLLLLMIMVNQSRYKSETAEQKISLADKQQTRQYGIFSTMERKRKYRN